MKCCLFSSDLQFVDLVTQFAVTFCDSCLVVADAYGSHSEINMSRFYFQNSTSYQLEMTVETKII